MLIQMQYNRSSMKENFLHFISETPGIVSINGKHIGNIDNITCLELDIITKTNNIFVTYSPISDSQNVIPYTFSLSTLEYPSTNNEYIKVIPFPNNNYDIIMKPFYYYQVSHSNVLFNKSVGKYFISIVSDNVCRITIFSGGSIVFNINIQPLKNAKVDERKGILIIEGIVDDNNYYLLLIDSSNFEILYNDIVQSIEITNDNITSYKNMNTLCHHAQINKLEFLSKTKENYYVYANKNNTAINPLLIPQTFLECIKVQDEVMAKAFLSNNLAESNINHFNNFFGDIKNIYFNRHNFSNKLNYTIESNAMKNYNFIMENNKIIEIEENF